MPRKVSNYIFDLEGKGEEWLISKDGGHIVAKFIDGDMQKSSPTIDVEELTLLITY